MDRKQDSIARELSRKWDSVKGRAQLLDTTIPVLAKSLGCGRSTLLRNKVWQRVIAPSRNTRADVDGWLRKQWKLKSGRTFLAEASTNQIAEKIGCSTSRIYASEFYKRIVAPYRQRKNRTTESRISSLLERKVRTEKGRLWLSTVYLKEIADKCATTVSRVAANTFYLTHIKPLREQVKAENTPSPQEKREIHRERQKTYRDTNRESIRLYHRRWEKQNRERRIEAKRERMRRYREAFPEKAKQVQERFWSVDRDSKLAKKAKKMRKYRRLYPEKHREASKRYAEQNPEKIKQYLKEYRSKNRDRLNARTRRRRKKDIQFKLSEYLRGRIVKVLRGKIKVRPGSAVRDLGCSLEQLISHLETQFRDGMSWDNWGRGEACWHIDHIVPLASFDLTVRRQFLQACHYTNLQPLWSRDNIRKGAKVIGPRPP